MVSVMIIGAGAIADSHVKGYLASGDSARIVALADPDTERASLLARRHGLDASIYEDYRDAFAAGGIDVVSVCTPPATHAAVAVDCLDASAHVLLEKPMASSLEECDRILDASRRNARLVSVVAQSRFVTPIRNVKRLLDEGVCGRLLYSEAYSAWWRSAAYHDLDYRGRWETEGGGCTLGHAVHHVDLLLWMAGKPAEITAVMGNLAHTNSELEDISLAVLRYDDGTLAQLTTSLIHHGEPQHMLFETERAGIGIPFSVRSSRGLANGFPEPDVEMETLVRETYEAYPPLAKEGHAGQIADFLAAIASGVSPLLTGETGRDALEVIIGVYKSAVTKSTVRLPIAPDDPFYVKAGMVSSMPRFFEKTRSVGRLGDGAISLAGDRLR